MALRGTLTHRKIRTLANMLGTSPCFALGVAEALWHVTAEQAPAGNIGRMNDADIAMEMFYDGDPKELSAALLACRLLEEHPEHRLIVHDWHIHADDAVDVRLARSVSYYANGMPPRMRRLANGEREKLKAQFEAETPVRTSAHAVRATSHVVRKPAPAPVPGNAPATGEPTPDMVAGAVMVKCGIGGMHTRMVLEAVVRSMAGKAGYSPACVCSQLIQSWQDYERLKPQLRITWGAEKFFGDGHWRTPDAWPRKDEGQKGPIDPCARQETQPGIQPGAIARWREARARGERLPDHISFALERLDRKTGEQPINQGVTHANGNSTTSRTA
jgi:hypothetical protein